MNRCCEAPGRAKLCLSAPRGERRIGFAALVFLLTLAPVLAQSPALQAPAQQPGEGAQVHTGTSSGLSTETRLDNLLADHQFASIAAQLGKLPPEEAQFYRGILANRSNDLKKSIALLEPLLDRVTASGNIQHQKLLREALAQDYLREGDWSKADAAYTALETKLGATLTPDERDQIEMPLKLLPLAKDNPPMTVEPCDPFSMQVSQDPLGLTDMPVFVDADPKSWMLDPTAPFNLIDRSTAHEVGLKISDDYATIRTLTGKPIQVHVAVIPRFTIGGRLTLRNMTVFVYNDSDYFFPHTQYQVEGVLGYPALAALGSLTVNEDSTIDVEPSKELPADGNDKQPKAGAPFYLDGDQIVVALGAPVAAAQAVVQAPAGSSDPAPDGTRMFAVDAGGQQTYLTSRYFDEHAAEFNHLKLGQFTIPGQSYGPQPAYTAVTVPLSVDKTTIQLHYVPVLIQPLGSAAIDDVYGVLGVDALGQLRSYTFDYRTMRFTAQNE